MFALLLVSAAAADLPVAPPPRVVDPFARWEKNIRAHEKRLTAHSPPPGGVLFAGSSSIVGWDVKKSFPGAGYVNVGFGGSVIADNTHFAPRLLNPHKPATIVFYAGDNDIAKGIKPDQVLADFKAFVTTVRKGNPECRVLFIAVKPSPARWKLFETQTRANALVRAYCGSEKGLVFVDVVPLMLGADGKPVPELFVKDGLHMTPKGYELWTAEVQKALAK
ncbi:MAG TPA: GDSL-type esterase/lipase family protein [Gemmata sp.]